jgi:glycosyltransferase involved in cell wall biosynthesis
MKYHFRNVTLLITHYNRSQSLERLLKSFQQQFCTFDDVVVSDDGSAAEHLDKIKSLQQEFSFRLITAPKNRGLGNNINKGQDAVRTPYTLYVQEDFEPIRGAAAHLADALEIMEQHPDFDIARLYAYLKYPYLRPFAKGFSVMLYKPWYLDYMKVFNYSDHPHLRRSNFLEKFGRYRENAPGDRTEYGMCVTFIRRKGKGIFYENFQSLFRHQNTEEEPSTVTRNSRQRSKNLFIRFARHTYRTLKYNYDIHISRQGR